MKQSSYTDEGHVLCEVIRFCACGKILSNNLLGVFLIVGWLVGVFSPHTCRCTVLTSGCDWLPDKSGVLGM